MSTSLSARARRRAFIPAALMLVGALVQRATVATQGLSAWKGGGMGMYSEYHYRDHELWLVLEGEGRDPQYEYLSDAQLRTMLATSARCLRFRGEACLNEVATHIDGLVDGVSAPYRLELWRFDRSERGFGRVLVERASRSADGASP